MGPPRKIHIKKRKTSLENIRNHIRKQEAVSQTLFQNKVCGYLSRILSIHFLNRLRECQEAIFN